MDTSQSTDIIDLLLKIAGLCIPPLLAWGLAVLQQRTHIQLTQQQRETVLHSAETAAGELLNDIRAGRITPTEIEHGHPLVRQRAVAALLPVKDAAAKLPVDDRGMQRLIVGKVGNKLGAAVEPKAGVYAPIASDHSSDPL